MSCKDDCNRLVTHNFVLGLPEKLTPLTIYFVKTGSTSMDMYVTDSKGVAHLIDGQGGAQIELNSPNSTIQIDGYNIDVADYIMEIINNIQNGYVISVDGDLVDNSDPANPIIATPNLLQVLQEGSVATLNDSPIAIGSVDTNTSEISSLELDAGSATLSGDSELILNSNNTIFFGVNVPTYAGKSIVTSINNTNLADSQGNVTLINDDSNYLKLTGETNQSVEGLVNFINATIADSPENATDIVNKAYVDAIMVGLVRLAGDWDASTGTFPTTGTGTGGTIRRGDSYIVNVAGIIAGQVYDVGDTFYSKINSPGQTATNWGRFEVPAGQATSVLPGILKLYTSTGTATDGTMTQLATTTAINAKVADTIIDGITTIAPSQNAVFDALALKQNNLVSGTNIKTVGGTTVLGSGDIPFPIEVQNSLTPNSTTLAPSVTATNSGLALKADLASPTFTGDPKAPTPTAGDNDTSIATTAFVQTAANAKVADAINDGVTTIAPSQNVVYDALLNKADLDSFGKLKLYEQPNLILSSVIDLADINNVRNDQSSVIRLLNGDLIAVYSHFGTSLIDTDPSTIYASRSSDEGKTWGTPFMLQDVISPYIGSYIPSLYKKSDGNILMVFFVRVTATPFESKIYKKLFDSNMNSLGSATEITMPTGYYPIASDRLYYDSDNNKLLLPYPKLLSIVGSIYVFEGRLLVSDDEGTTWVDAGISTGSDILDVTGKGGVSEPGTFKNPLGGLTYYYRTTIGNINATPLTYSGSSYTFGTTYKLLEGGDAQSTIKYWENKKLLLASRMRNVDFGVNNRTRLDLLTSVDGVVWKPIDELDFSINPYRLNEPSIYFDDANDYFLLSYSKAGFISNSYDLLSKRYHSLFLTSGYSPTFFNGISDDGKGNIYNGYQKTVATAATVTKVQNPNGGGYKSATNQTGAIKITLPTNAAIPITIKGTVNTPVTNKSFTFEITVLASSMATNTVTIQGGDNSVNYTVRFVNATKPIIYIGELATVWSIPHITIDEISASSVNLSTVADGWIIGFEASSFGTVAATKSNTLIYSNLSQPLTGLSTGSNTAITASNTKLEAFANLQSQIDVTKLVNSPAADFNTVGGFNRYLFSSAPTNAPTAGNYILANYGNSSLSATNRQLAFDLATPDFYTRRSVSQPWYKVWTENNFTSTDISNWNTAYAGDSNNVKLTGNQTIGGIKTFSSPITLTGVGSPTYAPGSLVYDTSNESLTFFNNDSNVGLQVGQEEWIRVRNDSGSTITNGTAVYISGSTSGLPNILPAQANALSTSAVAGIATENIPTNSIGYVTTLGVVNGLNTSTFTTGSTVYLSPTTPGGLTTTIPSSPNFRNRVGVVVVSNATTGSIHVSPSAGALGFGTANQILGMNSAGTGQEYKTINGTTGAISVTNAANSITVNTAFLTGSATLDFPSTNSANSSDLTITVTGAALGDCVALGVPSASVLANTNYTAWVSATNTATVRFNNYSSLAANPASGTFTVKIIR